MSHSPPARPAHQNAAQLAGGDKRANPNYVQVINNNTVNAKLVVHRKRADYLVKCGRAERIGADQIRLTTHEDNAGLQIDAAKWHDSTPGYFEMAPAGSDGYTVMQGTRGRGPSETPRIRHHVDGSRPYTKSPRNMRSIQTKIQSSSEHRERVEIVEHIKYGDLPFTANAL